MYRTGDKARFLANGDIEFMGRKDNQIKLRGYRIELQEIAAVCEQSTSVKQAVVVLAGKSNKQIVAYVVSNDDRPLQGSDLLPELAAKIPDYMLPNEFVVLDSLPLTPNGKIDLAQLPSLESLHQNKVQILAPRNELERQLVEVWQQVLQLPSVGIEDNFFDLGGNSFLLGELYVKIEALINDKLPLIELFKRPSIGKLAAYLQGKESATKKPLKAQRVNRQKAVKGHRNKMRELRKNG
jgi:acyl carrier protein